MKSPITGKEMRLAKELRMLKYRKDEFPVLYHYYLCEDTKEQFTIDELDILNLTQVHNLYRVKYGIPFIDEIKFVREKYDLSAAKMSDVLGFGANVYRQYEAGEMPTVANGRLIKLAEDPNEFKRLIHLSRHALEEHEYARVNKKMEHFMNGWSKVRDYYEKRLLGCTNPNIYNGFRMPRLEKIAAMVNYFAYYNQPFLTGLNKFMFYADFGHFKKHGYSVSGICYQAITRGPVPSNYGAIYNEAVNKGYAEIYEENFGEFVGEKFCTNEAKYLTKDLLSVSEIEILEKVSELFKGKSTKEIVEMSHNEKGWQDNVNTRKHISFFYSFDLEQI